MRAIHVVLVALSLAGAEPRALGAPSLQGPSSPAAAVDTNLDRLLAESQRAYETANPTRGFALLTEVHERAVSGGLAAHEAEALRRLALADVYGGRPSPALEKLTRARGIFATLGDRRGEVRAALQLAGVLRDTDDTASLALLRHTWTAFIEFDDPPGILESGKFLVYELPEGEEKDAIRRVALGLAPRLAARAPECSILHEWADELFSSGRLADAHGLLTKTIACFQQTPERSSEGRALVSLGRLYRAHGRLADALDCHTRALALQEQHASRRDPVAAIQSMNAIAVTLQHMGRPTEALPWFEKGLERARAAKVASAESFMQAGVASAYLALGRYPEAQALLGGALEREKNPSLVTAWLSQLALASLRLGQFEQALGYANRAVTASENQGHERALVARQNRAAVLIDLARFDEAGADLRVSLEIIERLRADTIPSDVMKRGFHDWHQRAFATYIDLLAGQGRARESLEVAEQARARAFLDLLATRSAHTRSAAPATPDEVLHAARRLQTTIVSYWVGERAISIWVATPEGRITLTRVPALPAPWPSSSRRRRAWPSIPGAGHAAACWSLIAHSARRGASSIGC